MSRPPRRARAAGSVAVFATLVLAPLPSCRHTPTDGFQLEVPGNIASKVAWYEVGVFAGPACGSLGPQLAGGVPPDGFVKRLAFKASDASPPDISNLPRAKYAIGVAARAADCSVLATGCSDVDLASVSSVIVLLSDVGGAPQGACTAGATCENARCIPGTNNNPNAGAGCSLQFIGAGPLADPLALVGTVMSAPAIAATPNGFLVGYREYDPSQGVARVTIVPVDNGGGGGAPRQASQTACLSSQTSDATGLLFSGSSGVLAAARAGCGGNAGIDLLPVDPSGKLGAAAFADLGAARVLLSTAHAMATSSAGDFLAYTQGSLASVAPLSGTSLGTAATFGGDGRITDAWVAATDEIVALLARGTPGAPPPPAIDASVDDGSAASEAGADDGGGDADTSAADAGAASDTGPPSPGGSTLRFNLISASDGGSPLASIGPPTVFSGNWGAVSALAGRAFVVSDGQAADRPVAYRAFDVGNASPSVDDAFQTRAATPIPVLYADVAFHQDHLFLAVERQGSIILDVFDHATTTPTFLREVPLNGDPRIPSISTVRDGRVAVVATDTRVMVAWTTQESLGPDDATGGYALFACTTP